jgi:RNA polymerase sigma-70 factor (ECF subfamily)
MRSRDSAHASDEMDPRPMSRESALADARAPLPDPAALDVSTSLRFRRIFDEHFPFVWRTLRRLGVAEGSLPDASQRVFWAAARRIDDVADDRARGFLFGTARRVASDFRRLSRRVVPTDDHDAMTDAAAPTTEELVDQKRARELLDEMLDMLDDDLREVLVLQEGEGMSLSEIADLVDIPLGTAASRLRRAREEFRRLLKRHMASGRIAGGPR